MVVFKSHMICPEPVVPVSPKVVNDMERGPRTGWTFEIVELAGGVRAGAE